MGAAGVPGDVVEVRVDEFPNETRNAILIRVDDELTWLPLSQVDRITRRPEGGGSVHVRRWLAQSRGLA